MYDTQLNDIEEQLYRLWLSTVPENQRDDSDYDMRGYAKSVGFIPQEEGHMPDTYKKPNHPTFSDESIYNGVDGHYGGRWARLAGQWLFFPSEENKERILSDGYFDDTAKIVF